MANTYVRIYPGHDPESNIIGFSERAVDAAQTTEFQDFMVDRNYDIDYGVKAPEGSVSHAHVGIRPPLSAEHTQELGNMCAAGLVDGGSNLVYTLDNRQDMPGHPYGPGIVIAVG